MASFAVILPAAGQSTRFASAQGKKTFLDLKGRAVWLRAAEVFVERDDVMQTLIVVAPDDVEEFTERFRPNLAFMDVEIVSGGESRMESVANALERVRDEADFVAVHDAARPFILPQIISDCLEVLNKCEGTAPVIDVSNSMIKLNNGKATYVDRSKICEVQTPQCFKKELILEVLTDTLEGTDEIGMVLRKFPESQLEFVKGSLNNAKITTDSDIKHFTN